MVKIRYAELPAGLHVTAEDDRLDTVVYLQPGLTATQRRAALIRVRSSARMGQGPAMPALAMARALAADRVRTTTRIGAAAMRKHPMLVLPPLIVIVSSAVFVLMSVAPPRVGPHSQIGTTIPSLRVDTRHGPSKHGEKDHTALADRTATSRHVHTRHRRSPSPSTSSSAGVSVSPTLPPSSQPRSLLPRPSPSASHPCITLGPLGLCVQT
jgi:hypothetical protein